MAGATDPEFDEVFDWLAVGSRILGALHMRDGGVPIAVAGPALMTCGILGCGKTVLFEDATVRLVSLAPAQTLPRIASAAGLLAEAGSPPALLQGIRGLGLIHNLSILDAGKPRDGLLHCGRRAPLAAAMMRGEVAAHWGSAPAVRDRLESDGFLTGAALTPGGAVQVLAVRVDGAVGPRLILVEDWLDAGSGTPT